MIEWTAGPRFVKDFEYFSGEGQTLGYRVIGSHHWAGPAG